jgi:hypothetical protein
VTQQWGDGRVAARRWWHLRGQAERLAAWHQRVDATMEQDRRDVERTQSTDGVMPARDGRAAA